jgi:hypothetical protein
MRTGMPTMGPVGMGMGGVPGMGMGMGMGMQQQPMQAQPTGFGNTPGAGMGGVGGLQPPVQPLVPQKTGPPPPVRFGVTEGTKKLAPQPTGRRANLAAASKSFSFSLCPAFSPCGWLANSGGLAPDNPFGF